MVFEAGIRPRRERLRDDGCPWEILAERCGLADEENRGSRGEWCRIRVTMIAEAEEELPSFRTDSCGKRSNKLSRSPGRGHWNVLLRRGRERRNGTWTARGGLLLN
jgi:hypothetical protein